MTITAVWSISSPADANAGDGLTITEPAGVDELIRRLAEPGAGPASVWHEGRELADESTGMLDHDVVAAISGGYGYLSHFDAEHDFAVLAGDPHHSRGAGPLPLHSQAGAGRSLRSWLAHQRAALAGKWESQFQSIPVGVSSK